MSPTAVVLVLSCIQSHNKKLLTDIMIYFLANVGKCDPQPWLKDLSGLVRACVSSSPSFLHPTVQFLQKNPVCAKMTKKWSKMAQKCDFSTILKNFVINFCLKR